MHLPMYQLIIYIFIVTELCLRARRDACKETRPLAVKCACSWTIKDSAFIEQVRVIGQPCAREQGQVTLPDANKVK